MEKRLELWKPPAPESLLSAPLRALIRNLGAGSYRLADEQESAPERAAVPDVAARIIAESEREYAAYGHLIEGTKDDRERRAKRDSDN